MNCPHCQYATTFDRVRCPSCGSTFDADHLEELKHLEYMHQRLVEWRADGTANEAALASLSEMVAAELASIRREIELEAAGVSSTDAGSVRAEARPAAPALVPGGSPYQPEAAPTAIPAPARQPSAWQQQLRRSRQTIATEVALHGLLYFGVLLTFVGSLGFALFAFSGVNVSLRPVAEVLTPAFLFASSWYLRRRQLPLVGGSLELLAGAIALVALLTSFNDGVGFPPDLKGSALAAAWSASALALLAGYGLVVRRRPTSALRFLIAPLGWASLWSLGLVPNGQFSVWQYPLAAVGVAVSLGIAGRYPEHVVSRATQQAGLVGLPLVFGLAFLFDFGAGWQAWPLALTAAVVLAGSELLAPRFRAADHFPALQALLAACTLPALVPAWGGGRVGLLAVVLCIGLLELQAWRRSNVASRILLRTGLAAGLLVTIPSNVEAASAWGAASAWIHFRALWTTRLPLAAGSRQVALCAVLPLGFAYGLLRSLDHGLAWLLLAALLLAVSLLLRWQSVGRSDLTAARDFYGWFVPLAAAAVLIGTWSMGPPHGLARSIELPLAAALLATSFGLAPRWPRVRLWAAAVSAGTAVQLTLDGLALPATDRGLAWVLVGLAGAVAAWRWGHRPLSGHLLAAAYLAAAVGLQSASAPLRLPILSVWLLALLSGVVAAETETASLGWLVRQPAWLCRVLAAAPLVLLLGSIPFWIIEVGDLLGFFADRGRVGAALSLTAVGYGLMAGRLQGRRPVAPITAVGAVLVSLVGISVAAPELLPSIATVALAIGTVAALGGPLRQPFMTWLAWGLSAVLTILVAHQLGVPTGELPKVLMAWSAACLLGALAYDDLRAGRRTAGDGLRQGWLLKSVVLGAIGLPAGLAFVFSEASSVFGWWALGAAAAYILAAWQLRSGIISAVSWGLAALAATVLLPWDAWREPMLWLPQAGLLVLLSFALSWRAGSGAWWARWDSSPLAIAHVLALVALTRSTSVGSMAITWAGFGVLSLDVAVWKRHWAWAAAGVALLLVGANRAGAGWFTIALALAALALVALASRTTRWLRWSAQWASAGAAGWAWWELLVWSDWSSAERLDASLLALSALALGSSAIVRLGRAAPSWLGASGVLLGNGLGLCMVYAPSRPAPWTLAVALLAATLGSGAVAPAIRWPGLRELALGLLFLSGEATVSALDLSTRAHLGVAVIAGLSALLIAVAGWRRAALQSWFQALFGYVGLQSVAAVVLSEALWPNRTGLIATLGILGVEAVGLGLVVRRASLLALAPPLLCAAWLLFVTEAARGGNVQWLTVPIGIALLSLVDIARLSRKPGVYEPIPKEVLLLLEFSGVALVCGAALVQAITADVAFAAMGVVWGLLIAGWALLTRVRRRMQVGVGTASFALLLLVAVPVARLVPYISGLALWTTLAGLGALFLLVATTLEQSRARLGIALRRLSDLMETWE